MASLLIENGRVVDPAQKLDKIAAILIQDGKIKQIDPRKEDVPVDVARIDASSRIVTPGLIDMHVHLREPGDEDSETIESGATAALSGGFTSIVCPPNTNPPIDTQASVAYVYERAESVKKCNVFPMCCISKGRKGKELAELGVLFESGAVACSDDGSSIENSCLMRLALEYCKMFNRPILCHEESAPLVEGGVMHEGLVSTQLGLKGMPAAAEDVMVARDITLAESLGARLHIMHVSTRGAVEAIRQAKARGVRVTAEVTPHHLTLTDRELRTFDSNFKMNPPLRSEEHVQACVEGLVDGAIDVIVTDHAPHAAEKKQREISVAPFGIIGVESSLPLMIQTLVDSGKLTWSQLVEKMALNPAKILGLPKGTLEPGRDADVTIIDPNYEWVYDESTISSLSKNSPYLGWKMKGRAVTVVVSGEVRLQR